MCQHKRFSCLGVSLAPCLVVHSAQRQGEPYSDGAEPSRSTPVVGAQVPGPTSRYELPLNRVPDDPRIGYNLFEEEVEMHVESIPSLRKVSRYVHM